MEYSKAVLDMKANLVFWKPSEKPTLIDRVGTNMESVFFIEACSSGFRSRPDWPMRALQNE